MGDSSLVQGHEGLVNGSTGNIRTTGADPGILERRGAVRGQSTKASAEGTSATGGSGGLPQKILKN